jgi:hypothetical protein
MRCVQATQEELITMAGDMQAATEEVSQLRKQLSALGAQLDAASSQISQQQAAVAALEDTKKKLQVRQGLLWGYWPSATLVHSCCTARGFLNTLSCNFMFCCRQLMRCCKAVCRLREHRWLLLPELSCCGEVTACANKLNTTAEW